MKSEINYTVIKSARKTIALQIKNGEILVKAPYGLGERDIKRFVSEHESWIEKRLAQEEKAKQTADELGLLGRDEIQALARSALEVIPKKVEYYAKLLGVSYGNITIRLQKTRWGSCSSKGNLNFNCLLMLAPDEVLDSVIVHELCHRKQMNHSERFYAEIYRIMPDYEKRRDWLVKNGEMLFRRAGKI